jgi:hypothetical protein
VLIVVSGALAGTRVSVGAQPILIGKGTPTGPSAPPSSGGGPAQLQISDDATVSTRHAEVVAQGGQVLVSDLGSTNGTFVNNQRIQRQVLQDGDLLRCGNTQLKLRVE